MHCVPDAEAATSWMRSSSHAHMQAGCTYLLGPHSCLLAVQAAELLA